MIEFTPINGHIEISPLEQDGFVQESQTHFEEKGKVVKIGRDVNVARYNFKEGDTVYFDSWLAAKLYVGKDADLQPIYRWLVKVEDIRAYETGEEHPPYTRMM